MRKIAVAALLAGLCVSPAMAQTPRNEVAPAGEQTSRADCVSQFRTADTNHDGVISPAEAEAAARFMPTTVDVSRNITQQDFMDACTALIPKGG